MPAMESTLESNDGRESIGFAVESAQQPGRQFDFGGQPPVFFLMRGAPCQQPPGSPKRIAPKRERTGGKANNCGSYSVVVHEAIVVSMKVESRYCRGNPMFGRKQMDVKFTAWDGNGPSWEA